MKKRFLFKVAFLCLGLFLIFPLPAYAYLDPGTGSYIIQMLVGAVLGGLFTVKLFWKNIKDFFTSRFSQKK